MHMLRIDNVMLTTSMIGYNACANMILATNYQ